ncbi:MAG: B12-binding domain-containing radical SAM protein [Patescibacteria group bacterium]
MLEIVQNNIKSGIISVPYIKNLDDIPPPARHLMQMDFYLNTKDRIQESYLYFVPLHSRTAAMIAGRGCPYNCIFCHNTWRGIPFRFHSPERVVSEIRDIKNKYNISHLFFIDDNLFVNKHWLREICRLLIHNQINIVWGCNARVDNIDSDILRIVKEAGCRQLTFGFESGSQRILDILRKGTTVEQNRLAIKMCKEAGILATGTFMIGNPTETEEDVRLTQQFIKENDIDNYGVCLTTPYPGTELWRWCEKRGFIPSKIEWQDFTFKEIPIRVCEAIPPQKIIRIVL